MKKRCWKRQPKERGCCSLSHHLPKKIEQTRKEVGEGSGEGVIRRSEMCDDVESTRRFRPIAVQSDACDGLVTIFISGLVLSLLHEML